MNIQYFHAIQSSIDSPSKAETNRRIAIRQVERDFPHSLDVDKFTLWELGSLTDIVFSLNIFNSEFSSVIGQKQEFTCLRDVPIQTGDMLYNPAQDMYWLVIYSSFRDYIYKTGLMYRCTHMIKWQDDKGNVWEYPVHDINSTQYNSGIDQGKNVDIVTSQHKLTTTADINTIYIPQDKRFFLGRNKTLPDVYKLTQNDTASQSYDRGTVSLTMLRSQYNPTTDDIDSWLCDVKTTPPSPITSGIEITYNGSPSIRAGGQKTVTANTTEPVASWEICNTLYPNNFTLDYSVPSNSCLIKCASDVDYINSTFKIRCTTESESTGTLQMGITGGV